MAAASAMSFATMNFRFEFCRIALPSWTLVPSSLMIIGTLMSIFSADRKDSPRQDVASQDTAENVDQNGFHVLVLPE